MEKVGYKSPPAETRFKAGNVANPGGKPVGARNQITARFLKALAKDFDEHGEAAIAECREKDAGTYIKVVAALLPKEIEVKRPLADLTDDDVAKLIAILGPGAEEVPASASDGTGSEAIN